MPTLVDKIWDQHEVAELDGGASLLYVDRMFLHERSGGRMLSGVFEGGHSVYDPKSVFATIDHIIDTDPGRTDKTKFPGGAEFIGFFRENAERAGIEIYDIDDARQGIVHVIAPELGIAQPGLTMVCGDSHTPTLGGIGALAWGIGVTQGEHALSTQCLPIVRPKQMRVRMDGVLSKCVSAKDVILHLIGREGALGGKGYAIEFAGSAVGAMSPSARMTLCNMAVEFGGWTGVVAPDDQVFEYLDGRPYTPKREDWERALTYWKRLFSDDEAQFDRELTVDVGSLSPQVTWGTSVEHVVALDGVVPDPAGVADTTQRSSMEQALSYMDFRPGTKMAGLPIDAAFIGSCTNGRIEDLRDAAVQLQGRRIVTGLKALCVPGSMAVKRQAEAEGLDNIFKAAGFEWREAGCSLCFYAGGDSFGDAKRVISTTNRNFQNRQGPGVRTHLASPMTVAASAIAGCIADPRQMGG